jgi:hypothetical protein
MSRSRSAAPACAALRRCPDRCPGGVGPGDQAVEGDRDVSDDSSHARADPIRRPNPSLIHEACGGWTFADPWLTHSADPRHDLDITATSLVKTYARGHGSTYPDMPWEPKQTFSAIASFYATH